MNKEFVLEKINQTQSRIVYLSGKTCTGKTTVATYLERHGYLKVELDKIVMSSVVQRFDVREPDAFRTAYRDDGPSEHVASFIEAARSEINSRYSTTPLVIEGAISRGRILKEILRDHISEVLFIYFHPIHAVLYEQRILSRFIAGAKTGNAGLPKDFWALVRGEDLEYFRSSGEINKHILEAIRLFAAKSMEESITRLEHLVEEVPQFEVVEI